MKKSLVALTTAASLVALSACSGGNDASNANDSSKVIVETKAGNITQGDLYKQMKDTIGQDQFNTLVRSVTEEKVLSKKYKVTDKELDQQLNILREQYGDQVDSVIKQKGEKEVKDMLKVDILREKAATAGIKVSDKELKKAYDEYKAQKPHIRASHILVKDEKTANEVEAKIKKGEDFASLAKEYSTDQQSAANGGDLGYFGEGQMVKEFEEAAYKLKKGEVSKPIKTEYGYHIIKLVDKKKVESFEKKKPELEQQIKRSKVDQAEANKKIQKELDKAKVEVKDKNVKPIFEEGATDSQSGVETPQQ
ncbi:MAG: peptidylprolyl isomerase [Priestia megaterium]